jgi:hypothetical protein
MALNIKIITKIINNISRNIISEDGSVHIHTRERTYITYMLSFHEIIHMKDAMSL